MEKIVIFGSTGMTGLAATEAALEKGLKVTVLVRDPSRLPESLRNQVEVLQGNILNYDEVFKAIQGQNGVVVALGTGNDLKPTTDLSEGLKNIIKAMKESNIDIISVCLSAFLFTDAYSGGVPPIFKDITEEHQRMLDVLKQSGLKYIAVLPPHIADQPASSYHLEHDKHAGGRIVSKYDLGQFLIDSLTLPEHHGKVMGIKSK